MVQELKHYGVLGMKWGIRREASKDTGVKAAKAKSKADNKEWFDAANKLNKASSFAFGKERKAKKEAALDNAYDKLNKSIASDKAYKDTFKKAKAEAAKSIHKKGYDKATVERISNQSAGKTLAQTMVFGSYGALKYNQAKAKGSSTGKAFVTSALTTNVQLATGGLYGLVEKRAIKRSYSKP